LWDSSNGVIEFRRLFTGGVAREDGKLESRESICEAIRNIVGAEDTNYPLSDTQLANKLIHSGVKIARRTVTKYRERTGIPQEKLSSVTAPSANHRSIQTSRFFSTRGTGIYYSNTDSPITDKYPRNASPIIIVHFTGAFLVGSPPMGKERSYEE